MGAVPARQFATTHAAPAPRPLWLGLFGPSGGGKTWSALELATGIQSVLGGKIHLIDTESGRGLHYADTFDYEYTPFEPPHGSLDYLAAINHAAKTGARIVIIDSFSHEHEGEGGLIEYHEAEVERLSRGDSDRAEGVKMLAWTRPKAARKQLLRSMLAFGTKVVFILCFRADESSKPVKVEKDGKKKTEVVQMGFMPIAGKPFVYEATVCALLMPGANGVPTWNPENVGERMMRKLPEQFKQLFAQNKPLSRDHGQKLAEWAMGGASSRPRPTAVPSPDKSLSERVDAFTATLKAKNTIAGVESTWNHKNAAELRQQVDPETLDRMTLAYEARLDELKEASK